MKITKEIAHQVAEQLVAPKVKEREFLRKEIISICNSVVDKNLSKEEKELLSGKYSAYIRTSESAYFTGVGLNCQHFSGLKLFPKRNDTHMATFSLEKEEAALLSSLDKKIDKLDSEISSLKNEIKATVFGLSTFKRVQEAFPEAAALIKEKGPQTVALAINVDSIREKLK